MTLAYIRAVAEFCDRKFEFIPGVDSFNTSINEVRMEYASKDKVSGGTSKFCAFLLWQLKRSGLKPIVLYVTDYKDKFFVLYVSNYFVSYCDGRIYLEEECSWKILQYSSDFKEWNNVSRDTIGSPFSAGKLFGYCNYARSTA